MLVGNRFLAKLLTIGILLMIVGVALLFNSIRGREDDDGILRSLPARSTGTGFAIFAIVL